MVGIFPPEGFNCALRDILKLLFTSGYVHVYKPYMVQCISLPSGFRWYGSIFLPPLVRSQYVISSDRQIFMLTCHLFIYFKVNLSQSMPYKLSDTDKSTSISDNFVYWSENFVDSEIFTDK